MKKNFQLFLYNLRNSWLFLTIIFVELIICILLLSVAFTSFLGVNSQFAYYNKKVADKSYVTLDSYSSETDATAKNVSEWLSDDLKTLATTVTIGNAQSNKDETNSDTPRVTIATPALCANFNDKGLKLSFDSQNDYREAYISTINKDEYKLNQAYDIAVEYDNDIYRQKIKVVGYFDFKDYYYFASGNIYFNNVEMVVCDELPPFVQLSSGIFVNNEAPSHYKDLGFKALTVEEYYNYNKEYSNYDVFLYLAVVVILFTFVTIMCNYILSIDNTAKRNAVLYACGNTSSRGILIEGIKMLAVYLGAFVVALCLAELTIFIGAERQNIMLTRGNFYLSALIVFGLYLVAIVIGFVKFVKAKPLKVISVDKK